MIRLGIALMSISDVYKRQAQALQNKREFDERSRENNYDLLYKNECQNWRNKINRVKNTEGFPADRLAKIQASFSDFKKEALQRKKAVKTGTEMCIRDSAVAV